MMLTYRINTSDDKELKLVGKFNEQLIQYITDMIDTKQLTRLLLLRRNYIVDEATWIEWRTSKPNINVKQIASLILEAFKIEKDNKGRFNITFDNNIIIPNTNTSLARLIRFLNVGDNKIRGAGFLSNILIKINNFKINELWQSFIFQELGYITVNKIVTIN